MSSMEIPEGCARLVSLAATAKKMYDREGLKRHNWDHISRNFKRAQHLLTTEIAHTEITLAGVILHDIGYFNGNLKSHAHRGAEYSEGLLADQGFALEEVSAIQHCIVAHDPESGVMPETVEAKIVYDADMLDKVDLALIVMGSWVDVAEEFSVTVPGYAEFFIKRFEPLLKSGRDFYTEAGRRWDNGNLRLIIDVAKRITQPQH